MNSALVVVRPFAAYGPGAIIADPQEAARVLGDERAANVVRVVLPVAAAAESPPVPPPPSAQAPATQAADKPAKGA